MRRRDREVTDSDTILGIIGRCGVLRLGLIDPADEVPYIVPVNFAFAVEDGQLCFYLHGATAGRKHGLMQPGTLCSFELDNPLAVDVLPEKQDVTMRYESVMGKARIEAVGEAEKERILREALLARDPATAAAPLNRAALPRTAVWRLRVLEITAKVNPLQIKG